MRIGIDLGGSHIGVGLIDNNGNIILKKEKDLIKENKNNVISEIETTLNKYIKDLLKEKEISKNEIEFIGIAYPSSLRNGKMGLAINLNIQGYEIENYLKNTFKIPVYMRNDAKCAAICEKEFGSLNAYKNAIFLTIGTGIGGAVFINDKLFSIKENDTFEIGHMIINQNGILCKCGRMGCFEQYASIKALKNIVIKEFSIQQEITGIELHKFIMKNLKLKKMQEIIKEYINNLSIGIMNIITLFEPEAISIGGSFSYYEDIFLESLKERIHEMTNNTKDNYPKIFIATAKNDAGIIGASRLN